MPQHQEMPVDHGIDNTIALLREGYLYISNRRRHYHSDIFRTRLLGGQSVICMAGKEAAELFYDTDKFKRAGAAPKRIQKTLFGEKGLQSLDGQAHDNRKQLFMNLMTDERLNDMQTIVQKHWNQAIDRWETKTSVNLYDEANELLTRAACEWAGVVLDETEVNKRAKQLNALFEAGGAVGLKHMKGRQARKQVEAWCAGLIQDVRTGKRESEPGRALHDISWFKDSGGNYLASSIAAVELVNILRPIVAVSVYIAFTALALHQFPEERRKLSNEDDVQHFVQEVRRYYPFFPMTVARVKRDFIWNGYVFKNNTLAMLDVYGTNHHDALWETPDTFLPQRFEAWDSSPFDFIPQGGGDYYNNHRCPGEWLTIDIMKTSVDQLLNHMDYNVPDQDLSYSMTRLPSIPKSGFLMTDVQNAF